MLFTADQLHDSGFCSLTNKMPQSHLHTSLSGTALPLPRDRRAIGMKKSDHWGTVLLWQAMTGGRNDDTYTRVSGRERGGEIPMRLKLTAAGWIPDRGERERLSYCLRGTGRISQKRKNELS